MSALPHLLVRASAGTGKTYKLTSRYLALLFRGTDPDTVLATTFTRKAAYEIHVRVLERLAKAARGGKGLAELEEAIGRKSSTEECLEMLASLLRRMDRIRIGTIDSFFAQLARSCALDLGLPPGWRIADEAEGELLRSEAVAESVAAAEGRELLELLRDLRKQAVGPSVHEELLRFVGEGREALLESRAEAWEQIRALDDATKEELEAALAALPKLALPRTKSGKNAGAEKARWSKSREDILDRARRGDWPEVLDVGLVKKICAGETEFDRSAIEPAHLQVLRPIVAHALHLATEQTALQNRAARKLLEKHEESYGRLSRARGLLRFEDLPNALAPIAGGDPLIARGVDLEHRLDGRIEHLLLDEFQDTAPVQWRVLSSIADPILRDESGSRSFFCVGDVKQSIYGWRAAEPRLLGEFTKKRPTILTDELRVSFRSSAPVLETVNQVFERIADNPAFVDSDGKARVEAKAAAAEFQAGFVRHKPVKRAGGELPGAVHLVRTAVGEDRESKEGAVLSVVVERVREMLEEAPTASIGILTRRRKWIPELIHRLRKAGVHASDEGGNPLTDSLAVLHALSLLHLADHPGDLAAAFHVATSPLGRKVGLTAEEFEKGVGERAAKDSRSGVERGTVGDSGSATERTKSEGSGSGILQGRAEDSGSFIERGESEDSGSRVQRGKAEDSGRGIERVTSEVARGVRRALAEKGFGGFLSSIRPAAGDGYGEWDAGRFGQLIDLALAWEGRAGSRASAFVEHVRRTKVEDPSAEQVRVMTVHGAKGLEFDAVILPELDGVLARREDRLLTSRPEPEGKIEVVTHGARREVSKAHAKLERVRVEVAKRRMVEELCVLYVAMTRAIHRLDLIVQGREKEGGGLTYAAILRGALEVKAAGEEGVAWTQQKSAERWFTEASPVPEDASPDVDEQRQAGSRVPRTARAEALERGEKDRGREASAHRASEKDGETARNEGPNKTTLRLAPSVRPRSLPRLSPSNAKDVGKVSAGDLMRPHDAMTARGRIIHRLLAEVEWIENFDRSDEELMAIGRTIETNGETVAAAIAEFRCALTRPVTKRVLSRGEDCSEVWRERQFTVVLRTPDGIDTIWSGAFDRVVISKSGGEISARLIDFKTTRVAGDLVGLHATHFNYQLGAYRDALVEIFARALEGIEASCLFMHSDILWPLA